MLPVNSPVIGSLTSLTNDNASMSKELSTGESIRPEQQQTACMEPELSQNQASAQNQVLDGTT